MSDYLKAVQERVVIYDGAMGTCIQGYNLPLDQFWDKDGYNDVLVLSRPDVVKEIHAAYFDAGADVVETNTFSSTSIVMAEYDMADQRPRSELWWRRSWLARSPRATRTRVASALSRDRWAPRPSCLRSDTLALTTWRPRTTEQSIALIDGGVDVLLLETCQDILQAKAGLVGIFDALKKTGKNVPVQVQVTLEATGLMLLGTEIGAALTSLEMFDVAVIGMNCATGPKEMNDGVRYLGFNSPRPVSVLPNAGLPRNEGGQRRL